MTHDNVTDIVERLNDAQVHTSGTAQADILLWDAADTIATLRKQIDNAREALELMLSENSKSARDKAREALKGQP